MVFIVLNLTVVAVVQAQSTNGTQLTVPLYPLPQIYGTVAGIFMLVLMGKKALFGGGGAILLGILAWYAYGRKNVKPRDGSTPLNAFLGRDEK